MSIFFRCLAESCDGSPPATRRRGGYSETLAGGQPGPTRAAPPAAYGVAARGGGSRGGCGSGGRSQRGASPPNDAANKGQVRACDMRAKCRHGVLRSVLRSVERGRGRAEREGPGVCLRHACDMPTKCPATCTAECGGGRGQEPGRVGAARWRGSWRGASRIALRSVSREGEERTGTGTPRASDQGT